VGDRQSVRTKHNMVTTQEQEGKSRRTRELLLLLPVVLHPPAHLPALTHTQSTTKRTLRPFGKRR
jgi:hypothetical protein